MAQYEREKIRKNMQIIRADQEYCEESNKYGYNFIKSYNYLEFKYSNIEYFNTLKIGDKGRLITNFVNGHPHYLYLVIEANAQMSVGPPNFVMYFDI